MQRPSGKGAPGYVRGVPPGKLAQAHVGETEVTGRNRAAAASQNHDRDHDPDEVRLENRNDTRIEADIELDAIDRLIVAELQRDGRMTNVELARRAGISAPPCLRRLRRLEDDGVIRGYRADTDPQALGWNITFFALVGLDSQKESALTGFETLVATWPEVRECHMIRGGGDFLLRLLARDTAHENELTRRLTEAPNVSRLQTLQTIRTSRNDAGVPL